VGSGGGAGIPASCGTGSRLGPAQTGGGDPGGRVVVDLAAKPRGGYSCMCGSGTELWPGAAREAESPAEWSSASADLRGGDLAGPLFLY
jgi:hypothetical protein